MGKGFFFSCYWFKPTNFLVDGMFYKLVYFAREGQENVSLRFMIETQWSLGSGETVRFTVRFKECRFPGGSGSVGFNLPDLSISTGRAANGRVHMQMWMGWGPLAGRSLTSSWRLCDRWEQNSHQLWRLNAYGGGGGEKSSAPWRQQCKTKWLWMEQLTGSIFHLQLHVEVISPNELKLLENCNSNGNLKGHYALQGLNSWTWIPAALSALKGKLQSFRRSNNSQKNF